MKLFIRVITVGLVFLTAACGSMRFPATASTESSTMPTTTASLPSNDQMAILSNDQRTGNTVGY